MGGTIYMELQVYIKNVVTKKGLVTRVSSRFARALDLLKFCYFLQTYLSPVKSAFYIRAATYTD